MPAVTPAISSVVQWLHGLPAGGRPSPELSSDSRSIKVGDIFFAYPGDQGDGRKYIDSAIENGALAVVYEADGFDWHTAWVVPHLAVADLKMAAGVIADGYYRHPGEKLFIAAVTGTNGKTSCAQWIASALSSLGEQAAVIGTLGVALFKNGEGQFASTGYTTPDAVLLQRELAQLRERGAAALAIEASSIGLAQGRMNGMHVDAALFTNLTRDHLDYHGDMAAYEAAKTALFDWPGLKHAVVNLDDAMGLRLARHLTGVVPLLGYTLDVPALDGALDDLASLRASSIVSRHAGTEFHLDSPFGSATVKTQLVGRFNVSNALGVMGVLLAKGVQFGQAVAAIEALAPAPGRMQRLGGNDASMVVIDYAHTPDALEKTLAALRPVANGRNGKLWCVFGCGGDRDPGKRPQMGLAAEAADHVVVTSDNPRGENPHDIIEQIVRGMKRVPHIVEDRASAILYAVKHAEKNDVILLAGKGHETTQEINGKKLPFSDADHAALALAAHATMMRPN